MHQQPGVYISTSALFSLSQTSINKGHIYQIYQQRKSPKPSIRSFDSLSFAGLARHQHFEPVSTRVPEPAKRGVLLLFWCGKKPWKRHPLVLAQGCWKILKMLELVHQTIQKLSKKHLVLVVSGTTQIFQENPQSRNIGRFTNMSQAGFLKKNKKKKKKKNNGRLSCEMNWQWQSTCWNKQTKTQYVGTRLFGVA